MCRKNLFLSLAMLCGFLTQTSFASESLDKIVVTVNDTVITQSEVNQMLEGAKKQMAANHMPIPPISALRKQVVDQLINKKLQMQVAEQMGAHATDEDVTKAIESIAKNNKVTIAQVYERVASQGLSKADYRKEIADEMVTQQIQQQEIGSKITITPQEAEDFMHSKAYQAYNTKEYHLEDILIVLPEAPSPEQVVAAKNRAQTLLAKIRAGTKFSAAAVAESGDTNALQGGDLGWRKLPEIPSAFADQLPRMQANDVFGPIQTPNGFHLIHLSGIRNLDQHISIDAQKKQVTQLIFQRKFEENLQNWMTRLRSAAVINMHPEG